MLSVENLYSLPVRRNQPAICDAKKTFGETPDSPIAETHVGPMVRDIPNQNADSIVFTVGKAA